MHDENNTQQTDNTKPVDALCRDWQKRVEWAEKLRKDSGAEERWKKNGRYMRGNVNDDGRGGLVRANLLYMTAFKLQALLYAKNPEIAAQPNTGIDDQAPEGLQGFAETLERVVNRQLLDAKLKRRAKGAVMAALTREIGWVKVTYQKDYQEDPIIRDRITDTQDNLEKVAGLMRQLEKGADGYDELEARNQELNEALRALEQQVEVEVASGIVIDKIAREDMIWDPAVRDWDNIEQAGWMRQRVWMPYEEARDRAPEGFNLGAATTRKWSSLSDDQRDQRAPDEFENAVCVNECWDRTTNTVYTWVEGVPQWFREPYTPDNLGERFFPFFGLVFYPLDGEIDPLCFVDLLLELQDEYNETRTNLREDRKDQRGYLIMDKGSDTNSVERVEDRAGREIVLVDGNGQPLQSVVIPGPMPSFNPAAYDTSPIRTEWEMLSGVHDAANGSVMTAKTATEAEILQESLQTVVGEMRDTLEDWLTDIARYTAELCLLELSSAEAQRIAGEDAVWPEEPDMDLAYNLVRLEIRAGSTGKPNRLREQETWRELYPLIVENAMKVRQMQMQGMDPTPEIEALKELLARHDERMDVTRFLPPPPPQPDPNDPMGGMPPGPAVPPTEPMQ